MTDSCEKDSENEEYMKIPREEYEHAPPRGNWGYIALGALALINLCCISPLTGFGLVYGQFLASIGDEASGTAIISGTFMMISMFTALIGDILLKRYSNRHVALVGALSYFTGSVGMIFMKSKIQMILFHCMFEGFGLGLMITSGYNAVVKCFDKKKTGFVMAFIQTMMALFNMLLPYAMVYLMSHLGFRKTLMVLSGCSVILFPAMVLLDPFKKHEDIVREKNIDVLGQLSFLKSDTIGSKRKSSILDLSLLKSPRFLNLIIGVSFSSASESAFNNLIRVILNDIDFSDEYVAFMVTIYYGADLISRVCFSIMAAFIHIEYKNVFLFGTFFTGVFRIVFILRDDYLYRTAILVLLGILKCMLEIPMMIILAVEYKDRYSNALALQMICNGTGALLLGPAIGLIKRLTGQNVIVIHFLTVLHLVTSICWTIENVYKKMTTKK